MELLSTSKLSSLQKKSANAIGVFKKTMADLANANRAIDSESKRIGEKVSKLNDERSKLHSLKIQNTKFIDKINEFLQV